MKIKGVAFDLEGTVVDVENAHHKGHFAVAKDVGVDLTLETALKLIPHFIGGPDEKIAEEIWDLSNKKYDKNFIAERDKFYYHKFLKSTVIQPRPGFLRTLEKIRKAGLKTSIGSLTGRDEAEVLLETSGLSKIFSRDLTVLREDVKNIKPAPDVFFETARRMGIDPKEQLVFEDSPNGIKAAVAAGSTAIGMPVYDKMEVIQKLLDEGVMKVFKSWYEIDVKKLLE
ncbi:HAD family phosphatase [Candidatus Wolfebacteria bacterium]|nr:HAD family phosphatase [Candidatus Wolfebacteria bacterium]